MIIISRKLKCILKKLFFFNFSFLFFFRSDNKILLNCNTNVNNTHIEFVVKNEHELVLVNQFAVNTEQDVLYYLLFLLEQHQLNPLTAKICVTGNIASDSELVSVLKKYIANLRLAGGNKSLIYSAVEGIPQHFNYTLLNRLFCE